MMLPNDVIALAEARREVIEHELRKQQTLAQLPKRTPRWRMATGSGLMWAGARLVKIGQGMAVKNGSQAISGIG